MRVLKIELKDFRNYESCSLDLAAGKNIIIGENAQGKSNLLEAIELCASGRSNRAEQDSDFIYWGRKACSLKLDFESDGDKQSLSLEIAQKPGTEISSSGRARLQKIIKVNGVSQTSVRGLLGRLPFVSFKSSDLNLLRGGPKFRRDWIDSIALRLRPSYHETLSNYAKSISQRNKLLKTLSEKGRLTAADNDELLVWDKQLARFGTAIIKMRLKLLAELLPLAQEQQTHLSRSNELLSIEYIFRASDLNSDQTSPENIDTSEPRVDRRSLSDLSQMEDIELARILVKLLKEYRGEELRRRQSLVGPHRDDLLFCLNKASAVAFASQGQQRSIVLSLKLAELKKVTEEIGDSPVLLLDDVLAELDSFRQALLLSAVTDNMQTIVTTTHLTGFDPKWLAGAKIMTVNAGQLVEQNATSLL